MGAPSSHGVDPRVTECSAASRLEESMFLKKMVSGAKKFLSAYFVFGSGVVFGAVVASVVSGVMMNVAMGEDGAARLLGFSECIQVSVVDRH